MNFYLAATKVCHRWLSRSRALASPTFPGYPIFWHRYRWQSDVDRSGLNAYG